MSSDSRPQQAQPAASCDTSCRVLQRVLEAAFSCHQQLLKGFGPSKPTSISQKSLVMLFFAAQGHIPGGRSRNFARLLFVPDYCHDVVVDMSGYNRRLAGSHLRDLVVSNSGICMEQHGQHVASVRRSPQLADQNHMLTSFNTMPAPHKSLKCAT